MITDFATLPEGFISASPIHYLRNHGTEVIAITCSKELRNVALPSFTLLATD